MGLIRDRSLAARMERFRKRTADLRSAVVLGAYGVGQHVIRQEGSNLEQIVPSMQGRETWAPGAKVTIATHAGKSGPAIIGKAPAGQQGGSGFALRRYPAGPAPATGPTCPVAITGKTYLAIFRSGTVLTACLYADGDFVEELAELDFVSPLAAPASGTSYQRIHSLGDTIIFRGRRSAENYVVTWNIETNEAHALNVDAIPSISDPLWPGSGSDLYFQSGGVARLQLYKVPVGADGDVDEPTARVGDEYLEGTETLAVPTILCSAGPGDFQVPALWLDDDTARVLYFSGSAWSLGAGRELVSISPAGNGLPCLGGTHAIRGTYTDGDFELPTLGLLPAAPGTPEINLLPADWNIDTWHNFSVAPSGTQVAIYGFLLDGETPDAGTDWLFRSAIAAQSYPEGCAVPRILVHQREGVGLPAILLARD